jgi:hypothetical protein
VQYAFESVLQGRVCLETLSFFRGLKVSSRGFPVLSDGRWWREAVDREGSPPGCAGLAAKRPRQGAHLTMEAPELPDRPDPDTGDSIFALSENDQGCGECLSLNEAEELADRVSPLGPLSIKTFRALPNQIARAVAALIDAHNVVVTTLASFALCLLTGAVDANEVPRLASHDAPTL